MAVEILIVGAGAIGAFYASRLAQAKDTRVSVICRSNYKAVAQHGFSVSSPKYGSYKFTPHHTFPSPDAARTHSSRTSQQWDYILVSTKALPDVSDDSQILEGLVGKNTAIVLVQNGLGIESPYVSRFPQAQILSAVTIASVAQPDHGVIQHNRWTRISIGPYLPHLDEQKTQQDGEKSLSDSDREATALNERLVRLLQAGGIKDAEAYSHSKLQMVRWHKIAINASMNPSAVLSGGSTNHDMAVDKELYEHLKGVMDEVLATAPQVLGTPLPDDLAPAAAILKSTQRNDSGSKPSMLMDWEAGKKMELEVILGNPIRLARQHGLDMPRMHTLYALLKKAQANREREKERDNKL